jgi:hypothetical protein
MKIIEEMEEKDRNYFGISLEIVDMEKYIYNIQN